MSKSSDDSFNGGSNPHLDIYAVGMCTLCLAHCIVLPLAATLLPIAGLMSNDELVHRLLVLLAAPATVWLVYKTALVKLNSMFIFGALTGLGLLLTAAFVEALSKFEVPLTLAGATILGFSHLQRWLRLRRFRRSEVQTS